MSGLVFMTSCYVILMVNLNAHTCLVLGTGELGGRLGRQIWGGGGGYGAALGGKKKHF